MPTTPSSDADIDILYAAHTASCTFLLDSEGVCRRIVLAPQGRRSASRTAGRCVGAQYVASLDGRAAGGLVEMPRPGAAMLFARIDSRGRVSLVRTGVVTSFESKAVEEDPFVDPGTVETSAPKLDTPRAARASEGDPDYYDANERTQRIHALRREDVAAALGTDDRDADNDLPTAEYHASEQTPTQITALRGRRSDPRVRAASAAAHAYEPEPVVPPAYSSDIQVSRRRR